MGVWCRWEDEIYISKIKFFLFIRYYSFIRIFGGIEIWGEVFLGFSKKFLKI